MMQLKFKWTDLKVDLLITLFFSLFWLWFAWQYGFANSPDALYRGVLGQSIAEGHPYFTHLKQGWLHEYGAWHHDAAHEPFLPVVFALFFLMFGNKIIIANLMSTLSAALLIFPLLRLSRKLFNTPWFAFFTYIFLVSNKDVAYLFEVLAGLSVPVSLLAIVFSIYFIWKMLGSGQKRWVWAAASALASFYLLRSDAQPIYFGLLLATLFIGPKMQERGNIIKLRAMWLISFCMVLPWFLRKLVLFGHPFFNHVTPILWADRGYDYWSYHESLPLPTPQTYFANHSLLDFMHKLFIAGPGNVYSNFQRAVSGPLWIYLVLFAVSMAFVYWRTEDRDKRFIYSILWIIFAGYFAVFSLVPVLDTRYFVPAYFILIFTILSALFMMKNHSKIHPYWKNLIFYALLSIIAFLLQRDFYLNFNKDYIRWSYSTLDQALENDPLIVALKNKNIGQQEVILGPFSDVQRLAFATGLTFIEEPDNLKQLADPERFFKKYKIRYALVDISGLLPPAMIEHKEIVGDRIMYTVRPEGKGPGRTEYLWKEIHLGEDQSIRASIKTGIRNRRIYIDGFHGNNLEDLISVREMGLRPYVSYDNYAAGKARLFQSGLLVVNWGMGKKEMTREEAEVIQKYIANGGRILLLCPAWVYVAYEKKGLERLIYNQIAGNFDLILTADYITAPFKVVNPKFKVPGIEKEMQGVFSGILFDKADPILVGSGGKAAAVAAKRGEAKIIVWAQDNLLKKAFLENPKGREFARRIINWLLL